MPIAYAIKTLLAKASYYCALDGPAWTRPADISWSCHPRLDLERSVYQKWTQYGMFKALLNDWATLMQAASQNTLDSAMKVAVRLLLPLRLMQDRMHVRQFSCMLQPDVRAILNAQTMQNKAYCHIRHQRQHWGRIKKRHTCMTCLCFSSTWRAASLDMLSFPVPSSRAFLVRSIKVPKLLRLR